MNTYEQNLVSSLESKDINERAVAAIELGKCGYIEALPKLRAIAVEDEDITALAGMYACWRLGEDNVSIKRIISMLDSSDEALVQQAVHTASAIGQDLVPKVKQFLDEGNKPNNSVLHLLEEIGGDEALHLIRSVDRSDPQLAQEIDDILLDWE